MRGPKAFAKAFWLQMLAITIVISLVVDLAQLITLLVGLVGLTATVALAAFALGYAVARARHAPT